jgi:hypothetical protein
MWDDVAGPPVSTSPWLGISAEGGGGGGESGRGERRRGGGGGEEGQGRDEEEERAIEDSNTGGGGEVKGAGRAEAGRRQGGAPTAERRSRRAVDPKARARTGPRRLGTRHATGGSAYVPARKPRSSSPIARVSRPVLHSVRPPTWSAPYCTRFQESTTRPGLGLGPPPLLLGARSVDPLPPASSLSRPRVDAGSPPSAQSRSLSSACVT